LEWPVTSKYLSQSTPTWFIWIFKRCRDTLKLRSNTIRFPTREWLHLWALSV
jgi:hypothetical protein